MNYTSDADHEYHQGSQQVPNHKTPIHDSHPPCIRFPESTSSRIDGPSSDIPRPGYETKVNHRTKKQAQKEQLSEGKRNPHLRRRVLYYSAQNGPFQNSQNSGPYQAHQAVYRRIDILHARQEVTRRLNHSFSPGSAVLCRIVRYLTTLPLFFHLPNKFFCSSSHS